MRKKSDIVEMMKIFEKDTPNPRCELDYTNAYTLLTAIVLSAQSTDKSVNLATKDLFKAADTPAKMLKLGSDGLKNYIKTIGLYNNKAKHILSLSRDLVEKFNGEVPMDRDALEGLAGVGRKSANVLLNVLLQAPLIAVDTHVTRVSHRLDFSQGKTPLEIEKDLNVLVPDEYKWRASHWLVLFGRYICKAVKPECEKCPVAQYCHSEDKRI